MVISLERCEGPFSFLSSSGSTTCSDSLSWASARRRSSALKWCIALRLLAFRLLRRASVSSSGVNVLQSQPKCVLSCVLMLLKVIVRLAPGITVRTCIIVAFAGHGTLQYYCIEMFWCYKNIVFPPYPWDWILGTGVSFHLVKICGTRNVKCVTFECRVTSPAIWQQSFERLVCDISNPRDGHADSTKVYYKIYRTSPL